METKTEHASLRPRSGSVRQSRQKSGVLSWTARDIERRLLFPGGRYTKVSSVLTGILGLVSTLLFYGVLQLSSLEQTKLREVFVERGPTQYLTTFLFFWCLAILTLKVMKLRLQRRALQLRVVPKDVGFVLSPANAAELLQHVHELVDDPRHFLVLNRLVIAISNLRNLGRVGDVDDILRSQAIQDEAGIETSYAILQGFVWAIPVLGFIGTVLGLSDAIGQFGGVLGATDDVSQISSSLKDVTAGLATAFDTTLVALAAALIVQLAITVVRKDEEEFLDAAMEFGIKNIVARLRLTDEGMGSEQ